MKKVTTLIPEYDRKSFKGIIHTDTVEGKIYYDRLKNQYFLCQNIRNGMSSPNKLGYTKSWNCDSGTERDLVIAAVSSLEVDIEETNYVYVSNRSEQDALFRKEKRILVAKLDCLNYPYVCVVGGQEHLHLAGHKIDISKWKFAVPVSDKPTWKPLTISVSSDYVATVEADHVKVGCQTISFSKVKEVYAAVCQAEEFKSEN